MFHFSPERSVRDWNTGVRCFEIGPKSQDDVRPYDPLLRNDGVLQCSGIGGGR